MSKRTEHKYLIDKSSIPGLSQYVSAHSVFTLKYNVYSLYFDDSRFKSAIDHLEGVYFRSKFRFRFYTDIHGRFVNGFYFEIKSKEGSFGFKNRKELPEFDEFIGSICNSNSLYNVFSLFRLIFHNLLFNLGLDKLGLEPVILISYSRSRYLSIHEELNIDSDLNYQPFFFWHPGGRSVSDKVVLEVKSIAHKNKESISIPFLLGLNRVAFSKYINSLECLGVMDNYH